MWGVNDSEKKAPHFLHDYVLDRHSFFSNLVQILQQEQTDAISRAMSKDLNDAASYRYQNPKQMPENKKSTNVSRSQLTSKSNQTSPIYPTQRWDPERNVQT